MHVRRWYIFCSNGLKTWRDIILHCQLISPFSLILFKPPLIVWNKLGPSINMFTGSKEEIAAGAVVAVVVAPSQYFLSKNMEVKYSQHSLRTESVNFQRVRYSPSREPRTCMLCHCRTRTTD